MSKIDSTRLSQVLAALAKPKERVTSSAANNTSAAKVKKGEKDLEVLRVNLQSRLRDLKKSTEDFQEAAPVITVQEILRWEFGENILEHPEFGNISKKSLRPCWKTRTWKRLFMGLLIGWCHLNPD